MLKLLIYRLWDLVVMQERLLKILAGLIISKKAWIEFENVLSADRAVNLEFNAGHFGGPPRLQDPELTMIRSAEKKLNSLNGSIPFNKLVSFKFFGPGGHKLISSPLAQICGSGS